MSWDSEMVSPSTAYFVGVVETDPGPASSASTHTVVVLGVIFATPGVPVSTLVAGYTVNGWPASYARPSGATNRVPLTNVRSPPAGDSFLTVMVPEARVTFSLSTSYRCVPPATRSRPSGRKACPAQNKSVGV